MPVLFFLVCSPASPPQVQEGNWRPPPERDGCRPDFNRFQKELSRRLAGGNFRALQLAYYGSPLRQNSGHSGLWRAVWRRETGWIRAHDSGSGGIDTGLPASHAQNQRLFGTGSITKMVLAVLAMQMHNRLEQKSPGRDFIHTKLDKYFPKTKWKKPVPRVLDLLSHRSGVFGNREKMSQAQYQAIRDETRSPQASLRAILRSPQHRGAGKEWAYSGAAFVILGRILEIEGKQSLGEIFHQYLARPFQLRRTGFITHPSVRKWSGDMEAGFGFSGDRPIWTWSARGKRTRHAFGSSALFATAGDLARLVPAIWQILRNFQAGTSENPFENRRETSQIFRTPRMALERWLQKPRDGQAHLAEYLNWSRQWYRAYGLGFDLYVRGERGFARLNPPPFSLSSGDFAPEKKAPELRVWLEGLTRKLAGGIFPGNPRLVGHRGMINGFEGFILIRRAKSGPKISPAPLRWLVILGSGYGLEKKAGDFLKQQVDGCPGTG